MSIWVLAGPNGAGKSSIGGELIRASGGDYFNPDEAATAIQRANPGIAIEQANSAAWHEGRRLLERAIAEHGNFAFETSLGGKTIVKLLDQALEAGIAVHVWYVALASIELHLDRVRARVARGGHDIPERDVRRRYDASRANLIALLPRLASLHVYDNSEPADPDPDPRLILHLESGRVLEHCDLAHAPDWAKPILLVALDQ